MKKIKSLLINLFVLTLIVQIVNQFSSIFESSDFYILLVMDINGIDIEEDMEESSENENSEKEDYVFQSEQYCNVQVSEKLTIMNNQASDGLFNLFDKPPILRPPKV